jgi:hypothetical protein
MKCWRDLSHDCVENDCPMWMEGFSSEDLARGTDSFGLNESKCACVYKVKFEFVQILAKLLTQMENDMDFDDDDDDDIMDEVITKLIEESKQKKMTHTVTPVSEQKKPAKTRSNKKGQKH